MKIDPRRLLFLLAIARTGGVLAAADELSVTPSAVSQQLARLEVETGQSLVSRTPRGAVLTPAGRTLVEAAESIERALDLAQNRLASEDEDPTGTVRIGSFQSFLMKVVVPRLAQWRELYPLLHLDLVEDDRDLLVRALRSDEIDVAVLEFDTGEPVRLLPRGLRELPLLDEPWKLVVPTGTLLSSDPTDLSRHRLRWLGVDAASASRQAVRRVRRMLGSTGAPVHRFQDNQTALALIAAGEGITLLPALAIPRELPEGVEAVDVPGLGTRRIVLRYREHSEAGSEAVSTVAALVHEAATELLGDAITG
ncbi:LysR family transcriptional regulator [Nocardioides sp. DS6]|uniref:LysR family transcriptional regulator n=1 Tax=Nocardioides eburneus TaxID=3231482 RepID=A0ABV3SYH7_9ACTN